MREYPFNLITDYIYEGYHISEKKEYEVITLPAMELITARRIDLMAKWMLIEAKERGMDIVPYVNLYDAHIAAFSGGKYIEPGSEEKNSIGKYLEVFDEIISDIKSKGFDNTISIVPMGAANEIIDGAHRVAASAYYNKTLTAIKFSEIERHFDAAYFKKNGLPEYYIDKMVEKYVTLKQNVHVAFLWPAAVDDELRDYSKDIIRNSTEMIYEKELVISRKEIHMLIRQIYDGQTWTGNFENGYNGAQYKGDMCFSEEGKLSVIFFECDSQSKIIDLKQRIRELFGIENHSIHITDSTEEANQAADLILNKNTRHFLKYGEPEMFPSAVRRIQRYKKWLRNEGKEINNFVIDSATTLSLYGLRETNDLDFLTIEENVISPADDIDNHESQLKYYNNNKIDMILNQDYYFTYFGLKFITLEVLRCMKNNRGEEKDNRDILLIDSKLN